MEAIIIICIHLTVMININMMKIIVKNYNRKT
jgi:hypothetical protein